VFSLFYFLVLLKKTEDRLGAREFGFYSSNFFSFVTGMFSSLLLFPFFLVTLSLFIEAATLDAGRMNISEGESIIFVSGATGFYYFLTNKQIQHKLDDNPKFLTGTIMGFFASAILLVFSLYL
jgi:hypothetical protein